MTPSRRRTHPYIALLALACAPSPPNEHDDVETGCCSEGEGEEGEGEGDIDLRTALTVLFATDCDPLAGVTPYATDDGEASTIVPCDMQPGTRRAVAWQSDLDVDCDGGQDATCTADPSYLPETSAETSTGEPLDANTLPFIVIPLPGHGFDYAEQGIALGDVAAVIYEDKIAYGVFGDEGPTDIIGEASYAMAQALGIDPDPVTGGADEGATFIVFPGANVDPIEDHDAAVTLGEAVARELVEGS